MWILGCASNRISFTLSLMTNDNTPATKADLATLAATMATKAAVDAAFKELKRYFDVMVETMRHDFQDAFRDGYQHLRNRQYDLERRIDRLERHASLA
jgi:acyl-CoA reductase-like NAD-dependent aldehyde dehydrogenase